MLRLIEKGYLFILVNLPERVEELDVANVPQETLLSACEAVNGIHCHYSNDAKNTNDTEKNGNEDKTEHFTVLLSGVNVFSLTK